VVAMYVMLCFSAVTALQVIYADAYADLQVVVGMVKLPPDNFSASKVVFVESACACTALVEENVAAYTGRVMLAKNAFAGTALVEKCAGSAGRVVVGENLAAGMVVVVENDV